MHKDIIIIGGGIIGLCAAYYLLKDGHKVTVMDKSDMTKGVSYINAGYITPSHIIPLASPGTMTQGLKWIFNASSPFYIKPRFDPEFFKWAWYFKRASTKAGVQKAIPLIKELNLLSKALYKALYDSNDLGTFHLEHKGVLVIYKTDKAGEKELTTAELARKEGLDLVILSADMLKRIEPGIHPEVKGAINYTCDSHTTPHLIMEKLKHYLAAQGVTLKRNEEVIHLKKSGNTITKLMTNKAEYSTDEIVIAAGSWAAKLARTIGLTLPLQAGKGYRINAKQPTHINMPAILSEAKVAVTPMQGFTRFGGTMEFSGVNHIIRKKRVHAIANSASTYYKDLNIGQDAIAAAQCGLRPIAPDGLPYIGRTSKANNLTIATGHAMMGWSLGPVTGKLIAEIISGKKTSLDITAYHPERRF